MLVLLVSPGLVDVDVVDAVTMLADQVGLVGPALVGHVGVPGIQTARCVGSFEQVREVAGVEEG